MKIIQITPGSGDHFYCENCLRDIDLVRTMDKLGHEVLMVPLYLPLRMALSESMHTEQVFYGGINVYLQQKISLFKHAPMWLDKLLNSTRLLNWAGTKSGMTSAEDLGQTTISMLQGTQGRQVKELDKLINWLSQIDNKPDIICLSNALLAGLAQSIHEKLHVPVVCLLQDEDGFLDALPEVYAKQAWQILADQVEYINGFIAVSKYYNLVMKERLSISSDKIFTVHAGIELPVMQEQRAIPAVPAIGFLSQMCAVKGLGILVEAFIILKQRKQLSQIKLYIAGGMSSADLSFVRQIKHRLKSQGVLEDVEFVSDFDRISRQEFFTRVSVVSVPEKIPPAHGRYVLESLGACVPVVLPDTGVFPELLKLCPGGVLYKSNTPEVLANALEPLLLDADYAFELGSQGRNAVQTHFDVMKTTQALLSLYESFI